MLPPPPSSAKLVLVVLASSKKLRPRKSSRNPVRRNPWGPPLGVKGRSTEKVALAPGARVISPVEKEAYKETGTVRDTPNACGNGRPVPSA